MSLVVRNPPANAGGIRGAGQEDPLEEGMATAVFLPGENSILAWTEEPGGIWPMGSQRIGHD